MASRALCLSGGGSRGSYQVGVMKALCEAGHEWSSVHGISVGALNGAWVAMNSEHEQKYNIEGLYAIWRAIEKTEDMVKPWSNIRFFNYLMSIWKGSLNSSKNLKTIIDNHIDLSRIKTSGIKLTVGCCSLNTGEYRSIDGGNQYIKDFVLASSLLPVVFEPLLIDGEKWVDGGIRHQIPLVEAIMERPDEIDVILTRNPVADNEVRTIRDLSKMRSAPRIALRASEILNDQVFQADFNAVLRAMRVLPHIKINLYLPRGRPVIHDSMLFDKDEIEQTIKQGYDETKEILEAQAAVKHKV